MVRPSAAVQRILDHSRRPVGRNLPGVIRLVSGDPDVPTPDYIRRALADAIMAGETHYADGQGEPALRAALAAQVSHAAGVAYGADQIVVTHGGSGALAAAILATVDPGDRVLLPEPTYSLYTDLIRYVDAEPVLVAQTAGFRLDLDALAAAAPGARMVIICHPNNPTGVVYGRAELAGLAEIAARHDLLVLADEAYDHIVYDGVEFVSTLAIPGLPERLLYCQTFSKTYAMTGWRIGYLAGPAPLITAASQMHRTVNGPMNAAVQRAALVAVTQPTDWPAQMCREYAARREIVQEMLADLPGVTVNAPEGTFYAFVKCDVGRSSTDLAAAALANGVALRNGTEYGPGGAGHLRIAFSSSRGDIQEGLLRLRAVIERTAG